MADRRPRLRCAVYTRKSSEEGLDQNFNSLHAQREACEAYIRSQKHEGWHSVATAYDDGGYSGGSMDRPGLQQLLADISNRSIDVIVVYKVDRLTRSLADFAKIVDILDRNGVSFVSVTQAFNTTTSMGRLTLNVLLSFAQFEREVTAERIRDKIAASKQKGLWMGGSVPLGYDAAGRTLTINETHAATIRLIYDRYLAVRSVNGLKAELDQADIRTKIWPNKRERMKGGTLFSRGHLYRILANPIYIGRIAHKDAVYEGQHEAIVDRTVWDAVQDQLRENGHIHRVKAYSKDPSLLAGLLVDDLGEKLVATHCVNQGRRFRYYVSASVLRSQQSHTGDKPRGQRVWRLPASEIEPVIIHLLAEHLLDKPWLLDHVVDPADSISTREILFKRAALFADQLRAQDRIAVRAVVLELVQSIIVGEAATTIWLKHRGVRGNAPGPSVDATKSLAIQSEIAWHRRGRETRLVIEGPTSPARRPDPALIKAIAQAHRWWDDLADGRYATVRSLAEAYGTGERYAARVLRLRFLPPALTRAIFAGSQPPDCTLRQLLLNADQHDLGWA